MTTNRCILSILGRRELLKSGIAIVAVGVFMSFVIGRAHAQEATLFASTTSDYTFVCNDAGTGSDRDLAAFRPTPAKGFFILGDSGTNKGSAITVKVRNDNPANPVLMPPTGYTQVWNDAGSGGDTDFAIWFPKAPDGYIAIGCVANKTHKEPKIDNYRCVRKDFVEETKVGPSIWSDKGSGASGDVVLYKIDRVANCFVAQNNYDAYSGTVYKLKVR